jgi:exodeoxyribonuclease V gamma subunit
MVLHGNRLEDLRDLLTTFLKAQPLPVLQPEVILVQSNGMKHWLEMALADEGALGICAATRMELPGGYLWQVYRAVLGADAVPRQMVFDKANLLWRLMRLLPALAGANPVYAPLQRYLGAQGEGRRLYQLAQQIADVFDGYQSYRADWLTDWAAGHNVLRAMGDRGGAAALEDVHCWQAQLWRDIRADVGESLADASRASVHARFMQALAQQVQTCQTTGTRPAGIAPRIVVFGISSLSMQTVEALALLGQVSQVLMLVQNPCRYFWGDIVEGHDQLRQQLHRRQQAKPFSHRVRQPGLFDPLPQHAATHPLLASWGKQGRDYLHLLDGFDQQEASRGSQSSKAQRVDAFVDPVTLATQPGQLAQMQSAILNLEPLPTQPLPLDADDHSITLMSTHSAQREVEVLHDCLLSWFDTDPALQPRDVMVMVPDMETFAPHIHAVFGRFARGQLRHIPYAVADTTARQSPLVQALEQLLNLPTSRISLVDWLSLFEVSAVRNRFDLTPADVTQLQAWLTMAGVRWGLDAQHRQRWGIAPEVVDRDQNTWAFGLRRLLLGYAVGQGSAWGNTLPQAAMGSLDTALLSKLLAWVEAIDVTLAELTGDKTPQQWFGLLGVLVERFFLADGDAEERLIQRLQEPLEIWQQACTDAQLESALSLEVVREHWLAHISEGGLNQRFFGGGVQFGTLMPMRSIPFKAICLLGMNDGDYPRQTAPRDFDLMAQSWRAGDRSRREDDRYLFLEALLSARERLYISWQGHRASDNTPQPPSVLVAQLVDYLNRGWTPGRQVQTQPLQPYSEAYFLQGSPYQTYDNEWARLHGPHSADAGAGAGAAPTPSAAPASGSGGLTGTAAPLALTLDDLRKLLRQPVDVFFQSRLHIRFDALEEDVPELEPFALNHLETHQIGQQLLQAADAEGALDDLRRSGRLPMAAFGLRQADSFARELDVVLKRQAPWRGKFPLECPAIAIDLSIDGVALTGTLNGLWGSQPDGPAGPCLQISQRLGAVLEGSAKARTARGHILVGLWVQHLAACASGMLLHSVQLGLDGQVELPPLPQAEALVQLQTLVQAYRQAWLRPLPVACKTGWAYWQIHSRQMQSRPADGKPGKAGKSDKPKDPHEEAQEVFEGGQYGGEYGESPYLARAFDGYQDLEAELPHWAELLYGPLAAHASVSVVAEEEADA